MPKGRFATLSSWSYSVYTAWLKCPFSVCLDKIQRIRITEPDNPAFVKGNRIHRAADSYIGSAGRAPALLPEMSAIKAKLVELRKRKARTEQDWAFTRDWLPTSWFGKDAYVRIKTDACADSLEPPEVDIIDWKTGRVYPEHAQQRSLYALGGLQLVQVGQLAGGSKETQLTAQHIYVDTGQTATEKYAMVSLAPLKREWAARTKQMMADTEFKAKPGHHCKWCKFARSKGGPCPEKM